MMAALVKLIFFIRRLEGKSNEINPEGLEGVLINTRYTNSSLTISIHNFLNLLFTNILVVV